MIRKIKENKKNIIELIIIFIITILFNLICNKISNDEIWNYGFAYNIATGLIPYRDFNMVITPLFPIVGSIFLLIFGKNLLIYHILNGIICMLIFHYIKKNNPQSYYIPYAIFLLYALPNYNVFCLLLFLILINLENKKTNDYIIGIILGLIFLTKQNLGIYLFIPSLLTKKPKKIIKRIIGFIIPNLFLLCYLLYNNSLYYFIDYTILGIKSFAEDNTKIYLSCIIILSISIIYLIYKYIKTKDSIIFYLISFHLLTYPLIEPYHLIIPLIPTISYFLNNLKLNRKIITYAFSIFIIIIFSINLFNIKSGNLSFPNDTKTYKYRSLTQNNVQSIKEVSKYISNIKGQLYIISDEAYLLKLESSIPINKYDLLNNGNLGKNGATRIINEIKDTCQTQNCTFLIDLEILQKPSNTQYNQSIVQYIINNYQNKGKLSEYEIMIYQNNQVD